MAGPRPFDLAWFDRFKSRRALALAIAGVNLVGIAYGFYYYRPQFAETPVWWWPFVPDSPLAVLWAELALLAFWLGRRPGVLDALAVVGNVQVGLWTVYVLTVYADSFDTFSFLRGEAPDLNAVLLVAHAGMAALALIFLHGLRERGRTDPRGVRLALAVAAAYYLAQDALDYFGHHLGLDFLEGCGLRPYTVPCDAAREPALAFVTFGLTLLGATVVWLAVRPVSTAGRH